MSAFKKKGKFGRNKQKIVFKPKIKRSDLTKKEIHGLQEKYSKIDPKSLTTFKDLPLSQSTQKGLKKAEFETPTEIQKESITLALKNFDVLGAAKTGSGKTLAFLIPILERLFTLRWSKLDGLGALVITPTRELAYQIFEVLRKIGEFHDFSAGLVIGGKDLKFESKRMSTCNIVICTPGRLLQHMDENPEFDSSNLKILVLDEADRCLDMGFAETMNAIIENLPIEGRQTLLFSATQTRSVKDLARLSLKNPMYVSVHENSSQSTPETLSQNYMVCEIDQKINILWSFIKSHKNKKILVFLQSCKQVKYMSELFRRLRCPATLLALYGTLHQLRRMAIYDEFCQSKQAVLFATDIAARGLDFPSVDWVVQVDCPEDATTYLHRVGRTARQAAVGQSLLILLPSEESGMLTQLRAYKIPIDKIEANPKKIQNVQRKIEAHLASDRELKETAQRAFHSYLKSTYLLKNKAVFDVFKLDTASFALSLGLAVQPRVRFIEKQIKLKESRNTENHHPSNEALIVKETESISAKKMLKLHHESEDESDDDDILTVKRANHEIQIDEADEELEPLEPPRSKTKILTKAAVAKKILKKKIQANQKLVFDEDGEAIPDGVTQKVSEEGKLYEIEEEDESGININKAKLILKSEDKFDKQRERDIIKLKKKEEKRKLKEAKKRKNQDESGEDSGSDLDEVNLDWLPDPDEVYGKDSDEEGSNGPHTISQNSKQFRKHSKSKKVKIEHKNSRDQLSVDEAFALKLLQRK